MQISYAFLSRYMRKISTSKLLPPSNSLIFYLRALILKLACFGFNNIALKNWDSVSHVIYTWLNQKAKAYTFMKVLGIMYFVFLYCSISKNFRIQNISHVLVSNFLFEFYKSDMQVSTKIFYS